MKTTENRRLTKASGMGDDFLDAYWLADDEILVLIELKHHLKEIETCKQFKVNLSGDTEKIFDQNL